MRRTYVRSEKYIVYHFEGFVYRVKISPAGGAGSTYYLLPPAGISGSPADQFEIPPGIPSSRMGG